MPRVTELQVNGRSVKVEAEPDRPLLSVLRDDLDLTGAKYGCGEGQCGACTVLLDGVAVRSCLTPVGTVRERKVTTVEGLEQYGKLSALQKAFLDAGAMQCAYCTSGMLMSASALLRKNPTATREEILHGMEGNVCRCGAYGRIVEAIAHAARAMQKGQK